VVRRILNENFNPLSFQAYLIGCSFDNFSNDWLSLLYVWTLMLLAWIIPMVFIMISYANIIKIFKSETLFSNGCKNQTFAEQQRHVVKFSFYTIRDYFFCKKKATLTELTNRKKFKSVFPKITSL
jgi:hypothetical protein